jgi:hypothetical protein
MSEAPGRLLIVAGAEAASVEELPADVRELVDDAEDILVVAPVLPSKLELWMNDTDRARVQADERLGAILDQVAADDVDRSVTGAVGDDTPIMAFDDAVRLFSPDHILIGLRSATHSSWQEEGLLREVRERFGIPVTVIEIDPSGRVTGAGGMLPG